MSTNLFALNPQGLGYSLQKFCNPEKPTGSDEVPPHRRVEFWQTMTPEQRMQNVGHLLNKIADIAREYGINVDPTPDLQQLTGQLEKLSQSEGFRPGTLTSDQESNQIVFRAIAGLLHQIGIKVYELENAYFQKDFFEPYNRQEIATTILSLL